MSLAVVNIKDYADKNVEMQLLHYTYDAELENQCLFKGKVTGMY